MSFEVHWGGLSQAKAGTALSNGSGASQGFGSSVAESIKGARGIASTATSTFYDERVVAEEQASPKQRLFDRLVDLKVKTSSLAMHLETAWRTGLFNELDQLLDADEWDLSDTLPKVESFVTFLRTTIFLGKIRRPGLGATCDGHILAGWITGKDRLTIEYRPDDQLRWVLTADGSTKSGSCAASNLKTDLAAFQPNRWFRSANNLRS
ncbi:hypothetical protein [Caulobacter sp. S45]|uniref:hypothetical protein n=1 Tax=Caulobacter sp. S45 TaxID=1641861 RepID=UPI00131CB1A2|nr:hypothetical protein [Caulobacter sp. S45]